MMLFCYSIYDNKALVFHPPFYASTDAQASRTFADVVNDVNTNIGRHPADFSLFLVGSYSDQKGELMPLSPVRHIVDAVALLVGRQQPFDFGARDESKDHLVERV